jgi:diaminopimelate decarboxylase
MDYFHRKDGQLFAEDVSLTDLARTVGTPCYVYSRATLERHWHAFDQTLAGHDHLVCYAVKANSNLAVLNILARLGSGFDIVSGGELSRVLAAGGNPARIVFSGVGKSPIEMQQALRAGIHCFNVESVAELEILQQVAADMNMVAPVSLRVNPDVDARTHPYISTGLRENKFGIDIQRAMDIYDHASSMPNLKLTGVDCHIGSQLTELDPFRDALQRVRELVLQLRDRDIQLQHIDVGGGLGIRYRDETPPSPAEYATVVRDVLADLGLAILLEPGRAICGNAGLLLTRVQYLKHTDERHFAIVDAAMNDLIRPALYDAWQAIEPVSESSATEAYLYDVVGPVCETGDFLGKQRELAIAAGDLLAVRSAGAYGFVMSSNYNSRPRAAEIMVDGNQYHVIRPRETVASLYADEQLLPE